MKELSCLEFVRIKRQEFVSRKWPGIHGAGMSCDTEHGNDFAPTPSTSPRLGEASSQEHMTCIAHSTLVFSPKAVESWGKPRDHFCIKTR